MGTPYTQKERMGVRIVEIYRVKSCCSQAWACSSVLGSDRCSKFPMYL